MFSARTHPNFCLEIFNCSGSFKFFTLQRIKMLTLYVLHYLILQSSASLLPSKLLLPEKYTYTVTAGFVSNLWYINYYCHKHKLFPHAKEGQNKKSLYQIVQVITHRLSEKGWNRQKNCFRRKTFFSLSSSCLAMSKEAFTPTCIALLLWSDVFCAVESQFKNLRL